MRILSTAVVLLALLVTNAAPQGAEERAQVAPQAALKALERWTETCHRRAHILDDEGEIELRGLLRGTRPLARSSFDGQRLVAVALLDVYGAGIRLGDSLDIQRVADGERLRELAEFELSLSLDRPLVRWLTKEVLVSPGTHPPNRRAACAFVLAGENEDQLLLALVTCARESEGIVREAALWSLSGRQTESVHKLFLGLLLKEDFEAPSPAFAALEQHFSKAHLAPNSPAIAGLFEYVRQRISDTDWRVAAHAINVSKALETPITAPLLIEALDVWIARADAGEPVRRIQHDLTKNLESRSGMRLGPHPARWRTWYSGVQSGQVPAHEAAADELRTQATFFGIHPLTDRVVFLIDHSGSMDGWMAPKDGRTASKSWTRYKEAIEQMLFLLQRMGPRTQFNVVLFDDGPTPWRSGLNSATPSRLNSVRKWLLARPPAGGTFLRRGFEAAIGLRPGEPLEHAHTEADTLIVLCDGQTAEGASWVRPLLRAVQTRTRWMVHSVQLGSFGDDTLRLLAELTGGEHVRL